MIFFFLFVFLSIYDDLEDLDEIIRKDTFESDVNKTLRSREKKFETPLILLIQNYKRPKNEAISTSAQQSSFQSKDVVEIERNFLSDDGNDFDDFLELYLKDKKKHTDSFETVSTSQEPSNVLLKSNEYCLKKPRVEIAPRLKNIVPHRILKGSRRYFRIEQIILNFIRDREPLSPRFSDLLRQLSTIARFDVSSLEKWSDIVEVILCILEVVHMFFFLEDFHSLHVKELSSLTTVNEIDDFLRRAIEDLKSKRLILPSDLKLKHTKDLSLLKISILKESFNEREASRTLRVLSLKLLKGSSISKLIVFLLQEIRSNKVKLMEINSILLFVFNRYSVEEDMKVFDKLHKKIQFLISKIIILINLVNIEFKNVAKSNLDKFVDRINLLILKSFISFLYKNKPLGIQKKIFAYKKKILQLPWQLESPLQPGNLVFINHIIGVRLDMIANFVIPFFKLTETKDLHLRVDYERTGFHYLLRVVKYTYDLGEILAQQENI